MATDRRFAPAPIIALVFATMALFLASAAESEEFTSISHPPSGKGLVYIYKPKTYGKSIYGIYIDGELVTKLRRNTHYIHVADPGKTQIVGVKKARIGELLPVLLGLEPDIKISVNIQPNQIYFVENTGALKVRFELVPREQALPRLQKTRRLPKIDG